MCGFPTVDSQSLLHPTLTNLEVEEQALDLLPGKLGVTFRKKLLLGLGVLRFLGCLWSVRVCLVFGLLRGVWCLFCYGMFGVWSVMLCLVFGQLGYVWCLICYDVFGVALIECVWCLVCYGVVGVWSAFPQFVT